jgi:protein-S-isoprenylcysteine O-methyltransferase Ste14
VAGTNEELDQRANTVDASLPEYWRRIFSGPPAAKGEIMKGLETRIPPPVVAILFAVIMWGLARLTPGVEIGYVPRLIAAVLLFGTGVVFELAGILSFRRARTTINPMSPHKASALVDSGIYRITRNPMYVGLALELCAWASFLASPAALIGVVGFISYIQVLQIRPEEQVLVGVFGDEYREYQARVRRWL